VAACRALCVSRTVFRMSLVMVVRRMLCSVRLPEDIRVIETCRSVSNVSMQILDFLNNIYVHVLVCVIK